ncbi:MAG TPA: four helix bundle protein [Gemmatimonadales bacterium]
MHKYRSLEAWKRAHEAILVVMRATDAVYHPRARAIFDQLRRAVVSVEANVVEGYALGTTALFRRHLRIATGSAAEAECLSRVAVELGYLSREAGARIEMLLGGSMKAIYGLMRTTIRTGK